MNIHWKDWCWSWNSNTLATWCEELTYLKRPWCGEKLKVGGEGDDRRWDGRMASPTQWTWVWVSSRSWWWTERPGMLQSMGSQRVGHHCNWTKLKSERERQIPYDIIYRWNLKYDTNELMYKTEAGSQIQGTDLWLPSRRVGLQACD